MSCYVATFYEDASNSALMTERAFSRLADIHTFFAIFKFKADISCSNCSILLSAELSIYFSTTTIQFIHCTQSFRSDIVFCPTETNIDLNGKMMFQE